MTRSYQAYCLLTAIAFTMALPAGAAPAAAATGRKYMIATVHPAASRAGLEVLRDGGNAVDAAVAAALTLSVVDGHNSGIGGGCLILIRTADGEFVAIDGREMAPAAATRDMYLRDGKPVPELSQTGPLAVGTPGALAAYQLAIEKYGKLKLARLLEPGLTAARDGCKVSRQLASAMKSQRKNLAKFPAAEAALLNADGEPYAAGDLLRQPDLAATYEALRKQGIDWFYRGPFAERVGTWMAEHDGLLTADDFANYQAKVRDPLRSTYRDYTIVGFPPPSSGGIHVAQMLNMLESFPLGQMHRESPPQALHVIAESMARAFADRAYWLGDSDFVDVPRGLLDQGYADALSSQIDQTRAVEVTGHGEPPSWKQDVFERHTTHIAAADTQGNWVAITATVNTTFGSKVIVPGTGVILNNQMDDFAIHPNTPNAFGLVGAENNAVAAGKRPLSSMSPTIVLDAQGDPLLTVGAAGGPKIITQVLLAVVRVLDFQQSLAEAVAAPRIHHQWRPALLSVEESLPQAWQDDLKRRGHDVQTLPSAGVTQAIMRDSDGKLIGVADPRADGLAVGE